MIDHPVILLSNLFAVSPIIALQCNMTVGADVHQAGSPRTNSFRGTKHNGLSMIAPCHGISGSTIWNGASQFDMCIPDKKEA